MEEIHKALKMAERAADDINTIDGNRKKEILARVYSERAMTLAMCLLIEEFKKAANLAPDAPSLP